MIKYLIIPTLFTISFSQTIIGEGMFGQELLSYVRDNYKTSTTLGYANARDILYGEIDLEENNQLACVYSGFTITLDVTQDPSTNAYNQGINCEHTWPQSMGASEEPQKSDLHHLYPCKSNVNSSRGNHPYSEINDQETDTWYRNDYSQNTIPTEFIDQYAEKLNGDIPLFEPREDHKGNAARAMFYFYAIYHEEADTNFWNTQKNTLFDWHVFDPSNQEELDRTWLIGSYQEGYPNPFIIDSSLARRIWLSNQGSGGSPPDSFSLLYPANNIEVNTLNPQFIWTSSRSEEYQDSVFYSLIIDTPEPGITTYYAELDTFFLITEPLPDNSIIYWQVLAEDIDGLQTLNQEGYQSFYTNITNETPSLPTLIAPITGSIQSTLSPGFYWTESLDPDPLDEITYKMYIEANSSGIWEHVDLDTNWYQPQSNLIDNSILTWYVEAIDLNGIVSSSDSSFFYTDQYPEAPMAFTTVFPANQSVHENSEIQFIWNRPIDPDPIERFNYQIVYVETEEDWLDSSNYVYSEVIQSDTSLTLFLESNSRYFWGVIATDSDGFSVASNGGLPQELFIGDLELSQNRFSMHYSLDQNFPNPFNPTTKISYQISKEGHVSLIVYDIKGRKIITLVNEHQNIGRYSLSWNGRNDLGEIISGGMYICRIEAGSFSDTKKLLYIK